MFFFNRTSILSDFWGFTNIEFAIHQEYRLWRSWFKFDVIDKTESPDEISVVSSAKSLHRDEVIARGRSLI